MGKSADFSVKLLPNMLLAVLVRNGKTSVPHGSTRLQPGDTAVLCTEGVSELPDICLKEIKITADHRWCGRTLSQGEMKNNTLVIMVKRGDRVIIPNGSTQILAGDVVIVYMKSKNFSAE